MHVRIEALVVRVWFSIVHGLVIYILVGTFVMNRHVQGIFFFSRILTQRESRQVYISALTRKNEKLTNAFVTKDVSTMTKIPRKNDVRIVRQKMIPERSKPIVLDAYTIPGLRLIESNPVLLGREQHIVTAGVANILPSIPFYVILTNFLTKPVHLPNMMVVACGMEYPTFRENSGGQSRPANNESEVNFF